jgi:hypothetical protein
MPVHAFLLQVILPWLVLAVVMVAGIYLHSRWSLRRWHRRHAREVFARWDYLGIPGPHGRPWSAGSRAEEKRP